MRNVSSVGPVCSINCVNVRCWLTAIRGLMKCKERSTRPKICLLLRRTHAVQPAQSPRLILRRLKLAALTIPQPSRARRCLYVALRLTWPHPACSWMKAHSDLKIRCSQVLKFMYLAPVSAEASAGKTALWKSCIKFGTCKCCHFSGTL